MKRFDVLLFSAALVVLGTTASVPAHAADDLSGSLGPELAFDLSVTKDGNGAGTVTSSPPGIDCGETCSANFDSGTTVTLTATPDTVSSFSRFTGWSGGCTGTGDCVVTMDQARSVTATFTSACVMNLTVPWPPSAQNTLLTVKQGRCLTWHFDQDSSVTETRGLGDSLGPWFDSGVKSSGSFSHRFPAAGTYQFQVMGPSTVTAIIQVPLKTSANRLRREQGQLSPSTAISVTWASQALAGYRFDIQYRHKFGEPYPVGAWTDWKVDQETTSAVFKASALNGRGRYQLRSRLENASTQRASKWSAIGGFRIS